MSNIKYPILDVNGKLFPSWIIYNFKNYKIQKQEYTNKIDRCKATNQEAETLKNYQVFLQKYLDFNSPYTSILLYHGLGSGKTGTTIGIYENLYKSSPLWNVFVLIKASLKKEWYGEFNKWLKNNPQKNEMIKNVHYISYDGPTANQQFEEELKQSDASKRNIYIIEEVHNFIRNVYNNIVTQKGRRAQDIYDRIVQEKQENADTRIITLSGTPMINEVYELGLLFNLLRPDTFQKSEVEFKNMFIENNKISANSMNMFQRRIMGLVSFYESSDPSVFAKKNMYEIDVEMSYYQSEIYKHWVGVETAFDRGHGNNTEQNKKSKIYKTYTRQACNFVFPHTGTYTGENRPRPSNFRITEQEAYDIIKAKQQKTDNQENKKLNAKSLSKQKDKDNYIKALLNYKNAFIEYMNKASGVDISKNHTLQDDIKNINELWNNHKEKEISDVSTNTVLNNTLLNNTLLSNTILSNTIKTTNMNIIIKDYIESKKSSLTLNNLYECSAKFINIIFNILQSKGPVVMYSNYVKMEGIEMFCEYLKCFGFGEYNEETSKNLKDNKDKKDNFRYSQYHGDINREFRSKYIKEVFNNDENIYGKLIKVILISPSGTEGLNLFNIRQVHITEPHWNEVRIIQTIGRGVRRCSHKLLELDQRYVDVYKYISYYHTITQTTDQYIKRLSEEKNNTNQTFLNALKEVAVDCELNIETNKLTNNIKCFKFDEPSLLTKQIGPAYKRERLDDKDISSGSNSENSYVKTVKVFKISAVTQLDESGTLFSDKEYYWLNTDTGAIYNYKYYYIVGQIKYDDNHNFVKNGMDFIINSMVAYD